MASHTHATSSGNARKNQACRWADHLDTGSDGGCARPIVCASSFPPPLPSLGSSTVTSAPSSAAPSTSTPTSRRRCAPRLPTRPSTVRPSTHAWRPCGPSSRAAAGAISGSSSTTIGPPVSAYPPSPRALPEEGLGTRTTTHKWLGSCMCGTGHRRAQHDSSSQLSWAR